MAAVMPALGLMQQRQIDYTRSNESEADRVGIRTLSRSGYDPRRWPTSSRRCNRPADEPGREREPVPDYLQTHPVTTTRISEARERAASWRRHRHRHHDDAWANASNAPRCRRPAHRQPRCCRRLTRGAGRHRRLSAGRASGCACSAPTRRAQAIREYEQMRAGSR
jgi:predicted Zn-dependent protease